MRGRRAPQSKGRCLAWTALIVLERAVWVVCCRHAQDTNQGSGAFGERDVVSVFAEGEVNLH